MSPSLQAEFLSVLIGIMRKSERNLLVCIDAKIYKKVFELLDDIENDVVANLLVDILTVLTSLTINVDELKLLLRYLKTENNTWVWRKAIFTSGFIICLFLEKTCCEIVEYLQTPSISTWTR